MKIAQMGFYSTNTGDNAALYNIREYIDADWTNINMQEEANASKSIPELVNLFIRPNRADYTIEDLGNKYINEI